MTSKQEIKEAAVDISIELRQLQVRMIFVSGKMKNLADDTHDQELQSHGQELRNASALLDNWIAGIEGAFL